MCVRACVGAHQRVRGHRQSHPAAPDSRPKSRTHGRAPVVSGRPGLTGNTAGDSATLLGARWDAACRSPNQDAAGPCTRDCAATGGTTGNSPHPPCPGRAALLLTCRADLATGRLQRNLCGEGAQPRLGFMKFPMGSELGKKLRSHPSRILAVVTTLGQKRVCWAISAGLPKVLPAADLFLIFCNHLCSCISRKAATSLGTSLHRDFLVVQSLRLHASTAGWSSNSCRGN